MKFQTPKGTRDLFPEDAEKLQKIIDTIIPTVEKYGFRQLITPSFESFELLSKKRRSNQKRNLLLQRQV